MTDKRCTHCNELKDVSNFHKHPSSGDGLNSWCKRCQKTFHKHNVAGISASSSTNLIKDILLEYDIPCVLGGDCGFTYIDLLAWGCVPVEAKTAHEVQENGYCFKFSKKTKNGLV